MMQPLSINPMVATNISNWNYGQRTFALSNAYNTMSGKPLRDLYQFAAPYYKTMNKHDREWMDLIYRKIVQEQASRVASAPLALSPSNCACKPRRRRRRRRRPVQNINVNLGQGPGYDPYTGMSYGEIDQLNPFELDAAFAGMPGYSPDGSLDGGYGPGEMPGGYGPGGMPRGSRRRRSGYNPYEDPARWGAGISSVASSAIRAGQAVSQANMAAQQAQWRREMQERQAEMQRQQQQFQQEMLRERMAERQSQSRQVFDEKMRQARELAELRKRRAEGQLDYQQKLQLERLEAQRRLQDARIAATSTVATNPYMDPRMYTSTQQPPVSSPEVEETQIGLPLILGGAALLLALTS